MAKVYNIPDDPNSDDDPQTKIEKVIKKFSSVALYLLSKLL